MQAWKYTIAYVIPLTVLVGYFIGGMYSYLTVFFVFVVIPVLDFILGIDDYNPSPEEMQQLENRLSFRLVLYLFVPVQLGLIFFGAYAITHSDRSFFELAGLTVSIGLTTGGLGITIAHELAHKKRFLDRTLGKTLLLTVCYLHFYIEHNLGHHVNVATPKDPATARFGESFYTFYRRTVIGSFKSAWQTEANRLQRLGDSVWHVRNQMLWFVSLPVLFAVLLGRFFGWQAVPFFFVQSVVAFSMLEVVNYLEHYGLERKETSPGKYEKVNMAHSWNANHRLTNFLLFKLQRHADHHVHPVRQYQTLRHFDESPQLPTGYAGMMLLALVPPVWRKVMDPKVRKLRLAD